MSTFLAVCAAVFLLAVCIVAVFLVQALIQLKQTLRSAELLADNVNQEVMRVQNITAAAANVANNIGGTLGKTAAVGFSVLRRLMRRKSASRWAPETRDGTDGRDRRSSNAFWS